MRPCSHSNEIRFAGKLDASTPTAMHAVNAFAKLFQKIPRSELCTQLHHTFGNAPCMLPVCSAAEEGTVHASASWPQVISVVAEGESLKGFPVKQSDESIEWEQRLREVLRSPENLSIFQDYQVDINEQVNLLQAHILRHAPDSAATPDGCMQDMHAENRSVHTDENGGGTVQKSTAFVGGGAPINSDLPVYIAVAGFDQGVLVDAFLSTVRKADSAKLGIDQNVLECMIRDVKADGLHVTVWHKNGGPGKDVSGGVISCEAKNNESKLEAVENNGAELKAGERAGAATGVKGLDWHACGRACMQVEGEEVLFHVCGFDLSRRCAAARVEILRDSVSECVWGVAERQQDHTHATLWTAPGVKARESGEVRGLVERGEDSAVHIVADNVVQLKGTVSLFH